MRKMYRILIVLACVAVVIVLIAVAGSGVQTFGDKYEGVDLTGDVTGIGRDDTYDGYLRACAGTPVGTEPVDVDIASFEGPGEIRDTDGKQGIYTPDGSAVTWKVTLEKAGLYNISIDYLTVESRGVDIERELSVNGAVPFSGASTLTFSRLWTDGGEVKKDNQGNDIRPTQVERFEWQTVSFRDSMGYVTDPYQFRFEAGENTITLKAVNEPMIIGRITLLPVADRISYTEYASLSEGASGPAGDITVRIQGEDADLRSSPSLYARYDRSSPATEPYSVTNTILNYIGGDAWTHPNEWIQWSFEVPEDGYYHISVKARQMYQRGALSARTVYIDGEVPFDGLETVTFAYNTGWEMRTLGDENGTPYRFYLTKGTHTIRLEVTMGEMGTILKEVEDSIYRLNQIYRKILVLTGVNPDRYRDYNLKQVYPEVIEAMELESKRLYKIVDDTVAITGQKSDRIAVAQTLAVQLEQFVKNNYRITESFSNFKDNITSLGTAMQNMSESKLDVDMIVVTAENTAVPVVKEGFFRKIAHEIRSCVSSFFVDYNSLGNKYEEDDEDTIDIWIVTGRDQSTILKSMVDEDFTGSRSIKANVKLVAADAILTAVVAGNGPDIVLSVDGWFAVNYAMRGAVEDLTQFPDFDEVVKDFCPSALTPLTYTGKDGRTGVYGLPETQTFSLLFYRKDVLEELGLKIPETWEELISELPTLQGNSLTVGIPFPDIAVADISVFNSMIYQRGGEIYNDSKTRTLIDEESGVSAFKLYTSLFNNYGLPTVFDFVSRFRSGEMPLGVAAYSTYNTLMVSAPEIRGLWDFALFPGTLDENGNIDRTVQSGGVCCLMIATDDEKTKANCWEFMKWWVSAESQVMFGREIESVLGSSARYATANTRALRQLAWSNAQLAILEEQMKNTKGFPEIAGGYSTTRHITNAIRKVINDKDDPRETLLNYARTINEEIEIKRREFGLPTE